MLVAVIVTFNRKELLIENLKMTLKQTITIDKIVIVDNCSTDGTYDYLDEKGYLSKDNFIYLKTEENIGGAGGFYTGIKYAYELGADWILLMDDDGRPQNNDTFKLLIDYGEQLLLENKNNGKYFINSLVISDELLSFKMGDKYTVAEAYECAKNGVLLNEANPFNGTLISRNLIKEIGFPNPSFFIKGDEVNYKQRALDSGALIATIVDSKYYHPRPNTYEKKVLGKKVPFFVEAPWKEYYATRNFTYMYKQKKQYKAIAFELLFVKFLAIISLDCKKIKTLKYVFKGVLDGWNEKLGPLIKP